MTDSKKQRSGEIQTAIRKALMQYWDPIGVADIPEASDEYDGYIGTVYQLLASGASDADIVNYLFKTETETMGLTRLGGHEDLREVVTKLREIDVRL